MFSNLLIQLRWVLRGSTVSKNRKMSGYHGSENSKSVTQAFLTICSWARSKVKLFIQFTINVGLWSQTSVYSFVAKFRKLYLNFMKNQENTRRKIPISRHHDGRYFETVIHGNLLRSSQKVNYCYVISNSKMKKKVAWIQSPDT